MSHFEHGAIDKTTQYLVDPKRALKRTWYDCPDCHRDVHVRKGEKRAAYFAHRPTRDNPCTYYNRNPSLDQQHKNAQLKLKHFLDNQVEIDIKRYCMCGCGWITGTIVPAIHSGKGKCEHRFKFNDSQKSADVVLLDGDTIVSIFEIVHTHYTQERDRPEPWFELSAKEINAIPSDSTKIKLTCIRQKQSNECIEEQAMKREAERKQWEARQTALLKQWEDERAHREQDAKEREAHNAQLTKQREAAEKIQRERWQKETARRRQEAEDHQKEMDKELAEERRRELETARGRQERETKALAHKKALQQQFKMLFRKHSAHVTRCAKCSNLATWLTASSWVGRCRTCETKIDAAVRSEMSPPTATVEGASPLD